MYQVIWTKKAVSSFQSISDFVFIQWNIDKALEFEDRVEQLLDKLALNPYIFQAVDKQPNLRKCVVNKQVSIIYRIEQKNVFLNLFIDNRSDHDYS